MTNNLSKTSSQSPVRRTSLFALVMATVCLFSLPSCGYSPAGDRAIVGGAGGAIAGGVLGGGRGAVAGAVIGGTLGVLSTPNYTQGYYPRPVPAGAYGAYY